jgi:hypothetical protein
MTKVPLFVPFVEMLLSVKRSWGMETQLERGWIPHPVSPALVPPGTQAHLTLCSCAQHLKLDGGRRENPKDLCPDWVCERIGWSFCRQGTRDRGTNDLLLPQGTDRVSQAHLVSDPHHASVLRPCTSGHAEACVFKRRASGQGPSKDPLTPISTTLAQVSLPSNLTHL